MVTNIKKGKSEFFDCPMDKIMGELAEWESKTLSRMGSVRPQTAGPNTV